MSVYYVCTCMHADRYGGGIDAGEVLGDMCNAIMTIAGVSEREREAGRNRPAARVGALDCARATTTRLAGFPRVVYTRECAQRVSSYYARDETKARFNGARDGQDICAEMRLGCSFVVRVCYL